MDLLCAPPPVLPAAMLMKRCPRCSHAVAPQHVSLEEVVFSCSNKQCLFPFDEEDLDSFFFPSSSLTHTAKGLNKRAQDVVTANSNNNSTNHTTKRTKIATVTATSTATKTFAALDNRNTSTRPTNKASSISRSSSSSSPSPSPPSFSPTFLQTVRDLMACTSGWLCDDVVNNFFSLIHKKYRAVFPNLGFLSSYFLVHAHCEQWSCTQQTLQAFSLAVRAHVEQIRNNNDNNSNNNNNNTNNSKTKKTLTNTQLPTNSVHTLLLPFHLPGHWTLVVITHTGIYYLLDSLGAQHEAPLALQQWLERTYPEVSWTFQVPFLTAHQSDTNNCGVYVCKYAEMLAQKKTITQIDRECAQMSIGAFRQSLLFQLEQQCLLSARATSTTSTKTATTTSPTPKIATPTRPMLPTVKSTATTTTATTTAQKAQTATATTPTASTASLKTPQKLAPPARSQHPPVVVAKQRPTTTIPTIATTATSTTAIVSPVVGTKSAHHVPFSQPQATQPNQPPSLTPSCSPSVSPVLSPSSFSSFSSISPSPSPTTATTATPTTTSDTLDDLEKFLFSSFEGDNNSTNNNINNNNINNSSNANNNYLFSFDSTNTNASNSVATCVDAGTSANVSDPLFFSAVAECTVGGGVGEEDFWVV